MKKFFLGAGMLMMMLCAGFESKAKGIKIGDVEVRLERGHKEWNADRTATFCVNRGLCLLVVKADVNLGGIRANVGTDENGKFILVISAETAAKFPGDFAQGSYPSEEILLPAEYTRQFGFDKGFKIQKGDYPVRRDDASGRYYIILN